jgi:hypothetical protein
MPPKVPVLPREAIERALYTTGVPAQDIRALLRSDDWRALESRNQQVTLFRDFVKNECHQTLASDVISYAFGIEASHVRKNYSKADKKRKPPDRPLALDEDQTTGVLALIRNGYGTHNYGAQEDILNFIESNFRKCLPYQWMTSFLKSHERLIC